MPPLVSVICICFNHARFVKEALESVWSQTYEPIELIVVDDASTDNSVQVIKQLIVDQQAVKTVFLSENVGNCKAFNLALAQCSGKYVIDLAADDVLFPERIQRGVDTLARAGDAYGLHFSDAIWMNEEGKQQYLHSERFPHHTVPTGDVYAVLIQKYFICPTSMMFTRELLTTTAGYDATLFYEDFDIQIRGSRYFKFCYSPEVLVKKRIVAGSLSQRQFIRRDRQRYSTYRVCEKILALNKNSREQQALHTRIAYQIRQCLTVADLGLAWKYLLLYKKSKQNRYEK